MLTEIEILEEILGNNSVDLRIKKNLSVLLAAINDWPVELTSLEEYVDKLQELIRADTTKINLQHFLKNVDVLSHAWQVESVSQAIEIFDYHQQQASLREIIMILKEELKRNHFLD